jgi:3-oxoacyl-[acyl-carrier-protein] synthase I
MRVAPIAIQNVGLVTSIGFTAPATCAALRAGATNPTETRFMGSDGQWIMAHQVALAQPWRGRTKLVKMAALTIAECLEPMPAKMREGLPLLLCIAERERPGRLDGLDEQLFTELQAELDLKFHSQHSAVVPMGRPGALLALAQARRLIHEQGVPHVLIAATDSLLDWRTLMVFGEQGRLLAEHNSNGFMPGEGAGAVLVGRSDGRAGELLCLGVGNGIEPAPVMSNEPLRAEGLTIAIKRALEDTGCEMHDLDFRISDISGEQYFFKEAALALARTLRKRKDEFDLWHPAEGIGEAGAVAGAAMIANALIACRKGYEKGPQILLHSAADGDRRVAAVVAWTGAAQ